ncbi:hypothetical protein [Bradyrhizobium sp. CCGUVB23]|uniref:hypothetical protein n=1 Tax=Bradyrhizobium sp. CCGUVB23 TaxID=2949630 RepID=UPI0020B45A91|nr:hypothetical protein [Bradyrhizobium sp. CCGUVB23]MCP3459732.1 hypothetical protein [Bradyrhizobium sp. CCGUVB23]
MYRARDMIELAALDRMNPAIVRQRLRSMLEKSRWGMILEPNHPSHSRDWIERKPVGENAGGFFCHV